MVMRKNKLWPIILKVKIIIFGSYSPVQLGYIQEFHLTNHSCGYLVPWQFHWEALLLCFAKPDVSSANYYELSMMWHTVGNSSSENIPGYVISTAFYSIVFWSIDNSFLFVNGTDVEGLSTENSVPHPEIFFWAISVENWNDHPFRHQF